MGHGKSWPRSHRQEHTQRSCAGAAGACHDRSYGCTARIRSPSTGVSLIPRLLSFPSRLSLALAPREGAGRSEPGALLRLDPAFEQKKKADKMADLAPGQRRKRAVEMLEASMAPRAPSLQSGFKSKPNLVHGGQSRPTATRPQGIGGRMAQDPAANEGCHTPVARKRHSPVESTDAVTPARLGSIYLSISELGKLQHAGKRPDRKALADFDLQALLERRVGEFGRNVYQSRLADKVVVLEAGTTMRRYAWECWGLQTWNKEESGSKGRTQHKMSSSELFAYNCAAASELD